MIYTRRTLGVVVALVLLTAVAALAAGQAATTTSTRTMGTCDATVSAGSTYTGRYDYTTPTRFDYSTADANCLFDELRRDHREIRSRLNAIDNGRTADRQTRWMELRQVLLPHMQGEERVFYPALQQTSSARTWGLRGEEEHAAAAAVFQKLDTGDFTSDRWSARFGVFKDAVARHIAEEEGSTFRSARRALNGDQLRQLCSNFMTQKQVAYTSQPLLMRPVSMSQMECVTRLAPPSYESMSYETMPYYEECVGFDDLSTQNMSLECPRCGVVVGTFTPAESSCIVYDDTATGVQTPTSTSQATQSGVEQQTGVQTNGMMPTAVESEGTLRCPGCGAEMGTVCPYYAPSDSGTTGTMQTPTGSSQPMNNNNQSNN